MKEENSCNCGCNENDTLICLCTLAIASVPMQPWEELYSPEEALREGTAFPSLNLPFFVTAQQETAKQPS